MIRERVCQHIVRFVHCQYMFILKENIQGYVLGYDRLIILFREIYPY